MIQRYIQHREFEKQRPQYQLEPIHTDIYAIPNDEGVHPCEKGDALMPLGKCDLYWINKNAEKIRKKIKLQKIMQDMLVLKKEVKVVDKKGKDITEEVVKTEIPKKLPKQKPAVQPTPNTPEKTEEVVKTEIPEKLPKQKPAVQPTPNTPEEVVKKIKKEATEKTKGLNLDKIVRYGAILVGVYFLLKPKKSVEKTTTTVKKVKV